MAASSSVLLTQSPTGKFAWEGIVVSIEDVCDLWPIVRTNFESRVPFKKTYLVNKDHSPVIVEKLSVEYILTTDARLRGRISQNQELSPSSYQFPYASVVLVSCEDQDEYKSILKPRLKSMLQNDDREWFIVFVSKAALTDAAQRMSKKVFSRLQDDFSSKRRDRCCKVDINVADTSAWDDVESKIVECIRNTLEKRMLYYEEESRKLSESRYTPSWVFSNFLTIKESSACMFEMAGIYEDAMREYSELELCYLELLNAGALKSKEFGGLDPGDDRAALLEVNRKTLGQFIQDDAVREFDFRQYLFARQAMLLFHSGRPAEVAARGFPFILSFSKILSQHEQQLPFCFRETWVITACLSVVRAMSERFVSKSLNPDAEKEFYRLRGDLFSHARTKFMRLADLIGYSTAIERSPCNSAALSMLPWPRPGTWPSFFPELQELAIARQQNAAGKGVVNGVNRKQLSLAPCALLREANRRRASLSAGNILELVDSRAHRKGKDSDVGPVLTSVHSLPSIATASEFQLGGARSPNNVYDKPMKLIEIQLAAESALLKNISDKKLQSALSSPDACEEFYLQLTQAAADSFHQSWRERHGVVLDGEIAFVQYRRGNIDAAAKLFEKVCALYAGERWHSLLAQVLPRLSDCQLNLKDFAGYLSSCSKLLSLGPGLVSDDNRKSLQTELVKLAHSGLPHPVSLDVSALLSFSPMGGPPLELCEGDPGVMQVSVWSGFPGEVALESLSFTLITTYSTDEGAKVVQRAEPTVLRPGKQHISIMLPPLRAGSYVLGALTGQIGQVKVRSHTYCPTSALSSKSGAPDSDDYLIVEKSLRPVLEVSAPRALVEISAVVAWGLLLGPPQWIGIVIQPKEYSLKDAVLHISPGSGLELCDPKVAEFELDSWRGKPSGGQNSLSSLSPETRTASESGESIELQPVEVVEGKIEYPNWASSMPGILWLRVVAKQPAECNAQSPLSPPSPRAPLSSPSFVLHRKRGSTVNTSYVEPRTEPSLRREEKNLTRFAGVLKDISVRLEFGAAHSQVCEKIISVQFAEPFRTITRVVRKGNDRAFLVQVTLVSQVVATTTIVSAELKLQPGFVHASSSIPDAQQLLPLSMTATSEGALLFAVSAETGWDRDDEPDRQETMLEVRYKISGHRKSGAHSPPEKEGDQDVTSDDKTLLFMTAFILKMPVLEQLLAVGLLPTPLEPPQLGQPVILQWRIERLKAGWAVLLQGQVEGEPASTKRQQGIPGDNEELMYEIKYNDENWMIAGRREGVISLPPEVGARVNIGMLCVPLVAGHVRPPSLRLPAISRAHINHTPAGPHLLRVLPPSPCTALCVAKHV